MKPLLLYIVEVLFCSGLFMLLWRMLLAERVPYRAARVYLLCSMAAAVAIPALNIPVYPAGAAASEIKALVLHDDVWTAEALGPAEAVRTAETVADDSAADWPAVLLRAIAVLTLAVSAASVSAIAANVVRVIVLRRNSVLIRDGGYTVAENSSVATPFTFFSTVFLPPALPERVRERILSHERSHVRHRHTAERMAMETLRAIFWFDPFLRLASRALAEVQEWEADSDVLAEGCDIAEYRTIVFHQLFGYNPDITCGLHNSLTKKRFIMMTKSFGSRRSLVRFAAVVPAAISMVMLCSFTAVKPDVAEQSPNSGCRIHIENSAIVLDGEPYSPEELEQSLKSKAAGGCREAVLSAAPKTPMRRVEEVKSLMRRAGVMKVTYNAAGNSAVRILPPPSSAQTPEVGIVEPNIGKRNSMFVAVNGKGDILVDFAALKSRSGMVGGYAALTALCCDFLKNEAGVEGWPEKERVEIPMPDSSARMYDRSRGVVFLQVSDDTPYEVYVEVQSAVLEAYARLRNEAAAAMFGAGYASLADEQRAAVDRAVPIIFMECGNHA